MLDYVARIIDGIEDRPPPLIDRPPVLAGDEVEPDGEPALGFAEGQSFMIEYLDASDNFSRRRVTVWGLMLSSTGWPSLYAKCHERNAMRQFRVDRIRCCIDYDGEVHDDVPLFMRDTFGMEADALLRDAEKYEYGPWLACREHIRHEASLLAALIRSDGHILPRETLIAADYLEKVAERKGVYLAGDQQRCVRDYVKRLKPRSTMVLSAIEYVRRLPQARVSEFFRVLVDVMDADERRHPAEIEVINSLSRDMLGVEVL